MEFGKRLKMITVLIGSKETSFTDFVDINCSSLSEVISKFRRK